MTTADVLVLLAAGMFVLGYLLINQVYLRLMLLIGTILYIWYYAVVDDAPLWSAIFASAATGTANLVGLLNLLYRSSRFAIPRKYRDIYSRFSVLPPGDFRNLMALAKRVRRPAGHLLTTKGQRPENLYFIIEGQIELEKFGKKFHLPDGIFVGEVAYLKNTGASATVVLHRESEVLEWDTIALRKKCRRHPRFRLALDALLSLDLVEKVARAGPPDDVSQASVAGSTSMRD
ncbi:cyclic nucleotide-binding domain-containing protein [Yoonia litorea]|nr:cyclic nucleotide-binding domain-containing protein [Yoonia litorea]